MLLRHALAESLVMAGVGGMAGLAVAWAGVRWLSALLPTDIPRADAIGMDVNVLLFTALVAVAVGLLSGLAPALRLMRTAVASVLKDAGRGAVMGRRGRWLARALVTVEAALALVLLSSAGLMMRSFGRLLDVDPGFRTSGVVTMEVALPAVRYPQGEQQRQFFEALMQRIRMLGDVEQAGAVSVLPLSPLGVQFELPFDVAGMEAASPSERPRGDYRTVMPG
jgi:putative ABC transport system permease protein